MKHVDKFVKYNISSFKGCLLKEASGLETLRHQINVSSNAFLSIPIVFGVNEKELVLEKIHCCSPLEKHWQMLASGLAELHVVKQPHYGFSENNFIGLNPQENGLSNDWGDFFFRQRLQFQVGLIKDVAIQSRFLKILDAVECALKGYLNEHCQFASLVHGDLWSGNVLFSDEKSQAKVWLIDPAIYFGDREVDLAMTELFGGFTEAFYKAYEKQFPLSLEYENKRVIYNLYHYLNHYNLFGGGYLVSCQQGFEHLNRTFG